MTTSAAPEPIESETITQAGVPLEPATTGRPDGQGNREDRLIHMRASGVSVLVRVDDGLPQIVHWGADLGELTPAELDEVASALTPGTSHAPAEQPQRVSLLPEPQSGWVGRPGLEGDRDGRDWCPTWRAQPGTVEHLTDVTRLHVVGRDEVAGLAATVDLELHESGLLRARAALSNLGSTEPTTKGAAEYRVAALRLALPVPGQAGELLDFAGRWTHERAPQRETWTVGAHSREARGGRSGHDAAYLLVAGEPGFGFRQGEAWGVHVGWSGNHEVYAERAFNGAQVLGGGELLSSGELRLAVGESYRTPWLYGSYGIGLDEVAGRFHQFLRAQPSHPAIQPVVLNTWESVYFDQSLDKLTALADKAAAVGVERFVLDDGWFGSRRDDRHGLGDWTVSSDVWPGGLTPLIEHVRGLGMQFGIWVEPEMVNLDSDLARSHPEYLAQVGDGHGPTSRYQYVLDLSHPGAYRHVRDQLDALLTEYPISYLKWDHNRPLIAAGHHPGGEPIGHAQTLAVYRLWDELRQAHPGLEIESCASGGGRVDLGILPRASRVWASDCNDPLERAEINRWTGLLVPPELLGAHAGPSPAHTTGRRHVAAFRYGVAAFGAMGIEEDLTRLTENELAEAAAYVAWHKRNRPLLHAGRIVTCEAPEGIVAHGVIAPHASRALFAVTHLTMPMTWPPGPLRLPGLDPDSRYRVQLDPLFADVALSAARPAWCETGVVATGRALGVTGVQLLPALPEQRYVIAVDQA